MAPEVGPVASPEPACVRFACKCLDDTQAHLLAEDLLDLALSRGGGELLLNLEAVESVSSYGLMRLMVLSRCLQAAGGKLCLTHLRPEVYATLLANRVTNLFDLSR